MRDKLIELINHAKEMREADAMDVVRESECDIFDKLAALRSEAEYVADYLIDHGVTVQRWIPVSERLPSDEKQVLAYIGYEDSLIGFMAMLTYFAYAPKPHWQHQSLFRKDQSVICWMPLPEPPKGE